MHVFTIDEGKPDFQSEVYYARNYLSKLKVDFTYTIYRDSDYFNEVQKLTETYRITTILAGGYGSASWVERLFGGSLIDSLLARVSIPVLVCQ